MSWAKLDDRMPRHPKVIHLSDAAFRLHIVGICYCAENLTDGFIQKRAARCFHSRAKQYIDELIDAGVWENTDGDYRIHDYLEWNPSREEVLRIREARKQAGSKGGQRSRPPQNPEANAQANASPSAQPNAQAKPKQNGSKTSSKTEAKRNPVPVPLTGSSSEDPSATATKTMAPRKRNDHWDTLTTIFGYSPTSRSEQKEWGQHCAELRRMNLDPAQLHEASRRYDAHMPNVQKTPRALVHNAEKLLARNQPPNRPLKARDLLALGDELEHLGNGATPSSSPSRIPQLEPPS